MKPWMKKLGIAYIVIGLVWCAINLPNLLEKSEFNNTKAVGIGVLRVIAWPIFVAMWFTEWRASKKLPTTK